MRGETLSHHRRVRVLALDPIARFGSMRKNAVVRSDQGSIWPQNSAKTGYPRPKFTLR
jgi:hypothetical protein